MDILFQNYKKNYLRLFSRLCQLCIEVILVNGSKFSLLHFKILKSYFKIFSGFQSCVEFMILSVMVRLQVDLSDIFW